MRVFTSIDEIVEVQKDHLGESEWLTVDQDRINLFAEATGDHQWIHTLPEQAVSGPFGTTIAHGFLTLSLIPLLVKQVYAIEATRMGVNYGLNRVRFLSPVKVGSEVRASTDLLSATMVDADSVQVELRTTIEIAGAAKPACVAETLSRYYR